MIWLLVPVFILAFLGLCDLYIAYRFIRKPQIDSTAGFTWYWASKWAFATQTKTMAEKLPFLSQDLTEALGIRPDDNKTT